MPLDAGAKFAGYTVIRLLGSGGMGEVYLVEHPRLPRRDALKILPADMSGDSEFRARFHREADLATEPGPSRSRRILLADFGIARQTNDDSGLTATNMTVGSVLYAAPEQLTGDALDGRADQYALAATAYHLFTGQPPFSHSNPAVVI